MREFTHKLLIDIPDLGLCKGDLMRVITPFCGPGSVVKCLDANDLERGGEPWILHIDMLEPLPDWPKIQKKMQRRIINHIRRRA